MDEIRFRLSNQLETLQVQASVIVQQGQQVLARWITQVRQLLEEFYQGEYGQRLKDFGQQLLTWAHTGWEQLQFQYYSLQFNPREFYQQLANLFTGGGILPVSRRELAFCVIGLTAGGLIGFTTGLTCHHPPRHMHHMKAIICHHYIGIEGVTTIDDVEMPAIQKPDDLLIQVKSASVNVVDAKICSGYARTYRQHLNSGKQRDLPVIIGRDCAGIVVDIGPSVIDFDIGDEVYLAVPSWAQGTMAEYLVVSETVVARRPKLVNFDAAASLPYSGCLAWDAIVNESVIDEGNARGKRILVYGGTTPVGCVLIQLTKLWGGYVVAACKQQAIPVAKALGADEVIPFNESNIEKELELQDKFDAIFYTGGPEIEDCILRNHLLPHGSYVSTVPEHLTSDTLGFVFGSIFSGYIRINLLIRYLFGLKPNQWNDGSKINTANLDALRQLVDADQLQAVVHKAYAPHNIEQALHEALNPNAVGSTIIRFH
ncbi:reticulon-4-interacting protein 1 homolog, mitochondrial-like isoform X1 [Diprion similis]|uniref:reticulon-4-interacting protein 1 homolog, mitochondrial-like isoform X1 n=1 Tax=Diprion similis TaxID=362088 RepID=UPI001EF7C82C|nr:reticulon-4-interacting protein 1 homolog, mitochondrial-like isoform X1 [Diprion similis]